MITSFQAEHTGAFTFANYVTAYGRAALPRCAGQLAGNSAPGGRAAGRCFAVPLAWGVARTDMPGRGFVRMLVLATFITPPYIGAVAWILLAGPERRLAEPRLDVR